MNARKPRFSLFLTGMALATFGVFALTPGCAAQDARDDLEETYEQPTAEQALAESSLSPQEPNTTENDPEPVDSSEPPASDALEPAAAAAVTPEQKKAIQWMKNRLGSRAYEHYCEKAVENAYGTTGVWASAKQHWQNATVHRNRNAPAGAFVYWNISKWGHVGIADGNGGFYSTGVGGKIGHPGSLGYFSNYVGWSKGTRPRR